MSRSIYRLPTKRKYSLSCNNFTVSVGVDGLNYINEAAPIVQKFVGQPLANLEKWMSKFGGFQKELLSEKELES